MYDVMLLFAPDLFDPDGVDSARIKMTTLMCNPINEYNQ
jgi:hypothetical protein